MSRRLDWPACQNTRDLGGIPLDGGLTRSGVWIRSDSVTHLTPEGMEAMVAYGVSTVIDLRTEAERLAAFPDSRFALGGSRSSRAPGVTYLDHSLVDVVRPRSDQGPPGVGRYIQIVDTRQPAFADVFHSIAAADGAVLFHCHAGKDRTGLIAAMLLELAGVAREHTAADYGETDVQLARQYETWLSKAPAEQLEEMRADLCCPADRILGVLEHVDRKWGGVASYLEAAGVSPQEIVHLSARLA